jgi:protein tyrosine phosphatase (PTP) superfamily phosphohydrolase (DUF442 family)
MFRRLSPLLFLIAASCCSTPRREVAYVAPPVAPPPCNRCAVPAIPPQYGPVPVPAAAVPAVPAGPVYTPPAIPPAAAVPGPGAIPGQVAAPGPVAGAVTPGAVVQGSYNAPATNANPSPAQEPYVRLAPPELSAPGPAPTAEPPLATQQPPSVTDKREPPQASTLAPVDIPQFAQARDRVATGLQPFPDGVAWLKDHGYRTVLHVRAPGTDDAAARRQFEKYGIRYLSLDADPRTLTKADVDRFNRVVTDEANLPLFVYDKDASLTGGLWYLHFRIMEGWSDEKARAEAGRLGFRQEQDDTHRTMWIAVQKLLEANGR